MANWISYNNKVRSKYNSGKLIAGENIVRWPEGAQPGGILFTIKYEQGGQKFRYSFSRTYAWVHAGDKTNSLITCGERDLGDFVDALIAEMPWPEDGWTANSATLDDADAALPE